MKSILIYIMIASETKIKDIYLRLSVDNIYIYICLVFLCFFSSFVYVTYLTGWWKYICIVKLFVYSMYLARRIYVVVVDLISVRNNLHIVHSSLYDLIFCSTITSSFGCRISFSNDKIHPISPSAFVNVACFHIFGYGSIVDLFMISF